MNVVPSRTFWRWAISSDGWPTIFTIGIGLATLVLLILVWVGVSSVPLPPSGVARAFYEAANERDFETAEQYLSKEARGQYVQLSESEREAFFGRITNDYTLTGTMHLNVRDYGRRAVVAFMLEFEDHMATAVRSEELVREGARWRLTWPVAERRWNDLVEPYDRSG